MVEKQFVGTSLLLMTIPTGCWTDCVWHVAVWHVAVATFATANLNSCKGVIHSLTTRIDKLLNPIIQNIAINDMYCCRNSRFSWLQPYINFFHMPFLFITFFYKIMEILLDCLKYKHYYYYVNCAITLNFFIYENVFLKIALLFQTSTTIFSVAL